MSNKYLIKWSIWIGACSAIYCFLYCLSPLSQYGVMQASFTALPIFFLAGAKKSDFLNYACSNVVGVLWGIIFLIVIGKLTSFFGVSVLGTALNNGITVGVLTTICVGFHFCVTSNTIISAVPAMFGAISSTFWIGGDLSKVIPLMITLILGVALAFACQYGVNFLNEEGNWCFKRQNEKDQEAAK